MTKARRIENIVGISDTLWQLHGKRVLSYIEQECGQPIPDECIGLIKRGFLYGAVCMEKAIGGNKRV